MLTRRALLAGGLGLLAAPVRVSPLWAQTPATPPVREISQIAGNVYRNVEGMYPHVQLHRRPN